MQRQSGSTTEPLDVNIVSGGGGGSVTQGTSPWVVSGTVTANGPLTDVQLRAAGVPTLNGFSIGPYDYVSLTQASTTDTYVFKSGGAGGTTVATLTITYTDSGKGTISNIAKT